MNNIKLRYKFLFLYFVCVLIPLITVDSLFLANISWMQEKEQAKELEYSIDRVNYNFTTSVQSVVSVSNALFMDETLYRFLTTEYSSKPNYYSKYLDHQKQSGVTYVHSIPEIYDFHIYVDNHTILDGGAYAKLNLVKDSDWYKELKESKNGLVMTKYMDVERLATKEVKKSVISLIRILNYNNPGKEIILKLDLNYDLFYNHIVNEQEDKKVYIFKGEQLLLATENKGAKGMVSSGMDDNKGGVVSSKNSISKNITLLGEDWTIVVSAGELDIWDFMLSSGWFLLVLALINFLLPTIMIYVIKTSFLHRIHLLDAHFYKLENENFEEISIACGSDEIGSLIKHYNIAITKIKDLIENSKTENEKRRVLEVSKKQAELNALLSQINPHFMYNTLECICMRSLIKGEKETANIVRNLSLLLREMSSWRQDNITISRELQFVEAYLGIQKYRFDEKLSFEIKLSEACKEKVIPKLTIVSFVENACVHGIEGALHPGKITVNVEVDLEGWYVVIRDTGCGMTTERLAQLKEQTVSTKFSALHESERTGILNAYLRLNMYFKEQLHFEISSLEDCGTTITVKIKEK